MSENTKQIWLVGGVANGRMLSVPDSVDKVQVPTLRVRCKHDPEGIGNETVVVTYRPLENTNRMNWWPDTDAVAFGWWCQKCQMKTTIGYLKAKLEKQEAIIDSIRAVLDGDDE